MRKQLLKLQKRISTKAERRFSEMLKKCHIPFKTKVIVKGREVDFVVGKYAIEISGHEQDTSKNEELAKLGYIPIHFSNREILTSNNLLLTKLKRLC